MTLPNLPTPEEKAAFWIWGWLNSLATDQSALEIERDVAKRALENWYIDNPCMKPKEGEKPDPCNCPSAVSPMGWSQRHQAACKWFKETE